MIHLLQNEGAQVKAYDPQAMELVGKFEKNIQLCENPYQVADGADALIMATMWNEFKQLDFSRIKASMKQPVVIDGRNCGIRKQCVNLVSYITVWDAVIGKAGINKEISYMVRK